MKGIKIGITGEMGSGKSYIASLFKDLGVKTYNCDERSKFLQNYNRPLRKQIIEYFGKDSYKNGELNRKYLSDIIFNNPEKKSQMTSFITPHLLKDFYAFYAGNKDEVFILVESAILFESGWSELMDCIMYVQVPESKRIERCIKRDNITPEEYKLRMKDQISTYIKVSKSNWILHNFTNEPKDRKVKEIYDSIMENHKYS